MLSFIFIRQSHALIEVENKNKTQEKAVQRNFCVSIFNTPLYILGHQQKPL